MGLSLPALLEPNAHSATLVLAIIVGLLSLVWVARTYRIDPGFAVDAALAALLLGVVAGRAEVVVANAVTAYADPLDYFRERPFAAMLDPRVGGLGQRSLTAVGLLAYVAIVARRPRWRHYAAAAAPAVGLASAVGWAGLAFTGAAAGAEGRTPILASLPDQYGIVAPRFPLQFAMASGHLLLAAVALLVLNRVVRPGAGLCLWAAGTAALGALLDSFRAEAVYLAPGVSRALVADAALALAWLVAAAAMIALGRQRPLPPEAEQPEAEPEAVEAAAVEARGSGA